MIVEFIDRKRLKADMKSLLADAEVCPKRFVALYLSINLAVNLIGSLVPAEGILNTFIFVFSLLLQAVLGAGFAMYCMAVRRNERVEYLALFDGFGFAGKIILLQVIIYIYVFFWSMLFVIPGIIAAYRLRFALYNLYESPDMSVIEAVNMSKQQTAGYKGQLFSLDLSYLGWTMLASLPVGVETFLIQMSQYTPVFQAGLTDWFWGLLSGVWMLGISLLYLPVYQCTELGYFDIAKRTSGIGAGLLPRDPDEDTF